MVRACLFDSSLPAGKRADCNSCVIVRTEGQGRTNWACSKVHMSLVTRLSRQAEFQCKVCERLFAARTEAKASPDISRQKISDHTFSYAFSPRAKLEQSFAILHPHLVGRR